MSALAAWRPRWLTAQALVLLCLARLLVALVPLRRWRERLGQGAGAEQGDLAAARMLAAHVERAAWRLPFATKCLPRAMALSWLLRRRALAHTVVIAARPAAQRGDQDSLHAWVEIDGRIVLGELPGPWLRLAELGGKPVGAAGS